MASTDWMAQLKGVWLHMEMMWHSYDIISHQSGDGIPRKHPCGGYKRLERIALSSITCKQTNKMILAPFLKVYRKHFGTHYTPGHETTLQWLTMDKIPNFTAPSLMCETPLHPCFVMREGHHPKMFLFMMEEYFFILGRLDMAEHEAWLELMHELLLLTQSQCQKKHGSGMGH